MIVTVRIPDELVVRAQRGLPKDIRLILEVALEDWVKQREALAATSPYEQEAP